jgi:hypothetical protein
MYNVQGLSRLIIDKNPIGVSTSVAEMLQPSISVSRHKANAKQTGTENRCSKSGQNEVKRNQPEKHWALPKYSTKQIED